MIVVSAFSLEELWLLTAEEVRGEGMSMEREDKERDKHPIDCCDGHNIKGGSPKLCCSLLSNSDDIPTFVFFKWLLIVSFSSAGRVPIKWVSQYILLLLAAGGGRLLLVLPR